MHLFLWHHYDFCWYNSWKFLACSLNIMFNCRCKMRRLSMEFGFPWVLHDFSTLLGKGSFGSHHFLGVRMVIDLPASRETHSDLAGSSKQKSCGRRPWDVALLVLLTTPLATNISPFKGTFEDDHFPFLQVGYVSFWRVALVWNGEQEFGESKIYWNLFILESQEATWLVPQHILDSDDIWLMLYTSSHWISGDGWLCTTQL